MMKVSDFIENTAKTLKTCVKLIFQSRKSKIHKSDCADTLVILANGPSLNKTLEDHLAFLKKCDCMAVNFAASTEIFNIIKPKFYILADP